MKDKYVACFMADYQIKTFKTFDDAKKWLNEMQTENSELGFSEESCYGKDWIAKITHRSKFVETANRKKEGYTNYSENGWENEDGDIWPYSEDFDIIGKIDMMEAVE